MLISHVLTELSDSQKEKLVSEVKDSSFFVWIEPGTKRESHTLINIRENLKDEFDFILPCPHQNSCPLQNSENDWCHFFAEPPTEIFHSAYWKEFNKYFSIDLRSLPLSFLVAVKKNKKDKILKDITVQSNSVLIGRVRAQKGFVTFQKCTNSGEVEDVRFQKREDKKIFKELQKSEFMREIDF